MKRNASNDTKIAIIATGPHTLRRVALFSSRLGWSGRKPGMICLLVALALPKTDNPPRVRNAPSEPRRTNAPMKNICTSFFIIIPNRFMDYLSGN